MKVELTPQTYTTTGEIDLNEAKESGTLTLRRLGFKAQTHALTFKSEATETVTAAPWEPNLNARIRFLLPKISVVLPRSPGAQSGKLTFDSEVVSLEKDAAGRSFRGKQMDVRSTVMEFMLDKSDINFSVSLTKNPKDPPLQSGPITLQGGRSYEIKVEDKALRVEPEVSAVLLTPADPSVKVYVVPEGADYQVVHTGKDVQIKVGNQPQQEYRGGGTAPLDMGLEEEKQFWALCYANGKVRRKTIHVTKEDFTSYRAKGTLARLPLPAIDDNTDATLDVTALPPGVSAMVTVDGKNYAVEAADRNPLKVEMESHSAAATINVHTPQYDLKGIGVTLTAGQTSDLKSQLASAMQRDQTLEIVSSGQNEITIVGIDGNLLPKPMPSNSYKAKVGTQVKLLLHSPGYYLKEEPVTVSAEQSKIVVQMERSKLPTTGAWVKKNSVDGADMIYIPAKSYTVGASTPVKEHELARTSALGGFWIYAYPVTVGQYNAFLEANHQKADNVAAGDAASRLPMTGITYEEACAYAKWAGGSLPKEAEWELAARGSSVGVYPWGDTWKPEQEKGWHYGKNAPVGSNAANHSSFGVGDIWGHVREWTSTSTDSMMIRGSSIARQDQKKYARLTWRSVEDAKPNKNYDDVGFRIVVRAATGN